MRLGAGQLASAPWEAILAGANLAAIGDGSPGNWEVFQFQTANLVAPDTFDLSLRLRGQLGTDATMPPVWPTGSVFVLIDEALTQLSLPSSARGTTRHLRIGPAGLPPDDPTYVHLTETFQGIGLRPYAPAHLRTAWRGGDLEIGWIRRTRIDGDSWDLPEVPLGETVESYVLRIVKDGTVLREECIDGPGWFYSAALRQADAAEPPFRIEVAQVSERFGPGLYAVTTVDA